MAIFLTILGVLLTNPLLHLIGIPADVFPESSTYLTIYFGGITFALIYNMGAGVLRAIGDSKRPLYFLVVACLTNIVLDLLFVRVFHMGVAGAAIATDISQALSALLVCIVLMKSDEVYALKVKDIRFHLPILKRIITIGYQPHYNKVLCLYPMLWFNPMSMPLVQMLSQDIQQLFVLMVL